MIIHDVPQLSPEWYELRRGVPTASDFKKIITAKDMKPSGSQQGYAEQLANDILGLAPNYFTNTEKPVNVHVARGRNLEEEAVAWYAMTRKVQTRKVGFCTTDDGRFGCSPDALIWDPTNRKWLAGIEVKCPSVDKHDKNVKKGKLPCEYTAQCHGGLVVTGLPYWIFLEYCPDSETPTICKRVEPDVFTQALREQLEAFDKLYTEVKRKLGVTKEPEVIDADAVAEWEAFFETGPELNTFNAKLKDVGKIKMPTKRQVWEAVKIFADRQGWEFVNTDQFKGFVAKSLSGSA